MMNRVAFAGIGGINVKPAKLAVPFGVTTCTRPLVPPPTIAVIVLSFNTVKDKAGVPPKLTAVAPVKPIPIIVSMLVLSADAGEKEDTVTFEVFAKEIVNVFV